MTLISCKEETKYAKYEKGNFLNEEIIKAYDERDLETLILPPISLENIDERLKNGSLYIVYPDEKVDDSDNYYLCGYLNNSIKKIVDEESAYYGYMGRKTYVDNWIEKENLSKKDNPIYWYKISKTESIPLKLENKFLVLVLENIDLIFESVDSKEKVKLSVMRENSNYYNDGRNNEKNNTLPKWAEGYWLQLVYNLNKTNLEEGLVLMGNYVNNFLQGTCLDMEYFDDVLYVNLENSTIYHDEDLTKKFEYKEKVENNDISYLFKLEDILNIIKK